MSFKKTRSHRHRLRKKLTNSERIRWEWDLCRPVGKHHVVVDRCSVAVRTGHSVERVPRWTRWTVGAAPGWIPTPCPVLAERQWSGTLSVPTDSFCLQVKTRDDAQYQEVWVALVVILFWMFWCDFIWYLCFYEIIVTDLLSRSCTD